MQRDRSFETKTLPLLHRLASLGFAAALLLVVACGGQDAGDVSDAASADAASTDTASSDADYADDMAAEHAGETPSASGATEGADVAGVDGAEVTYGAVGERALTGYLALPEGAEPGGPALIVIQEWWGLNDNIRAMARKLAAEGYTALAVDLYDDQVGDTPEAARALMESAMQRESELEENIREAYWYLTQERQASAVGSIGWCFGGGWSLRTALLFPRDLDAAVIYYGRVVTDADQLAPLDVPVLGLFGAEDEGIPVDTVRAFEATLQELGKSVEIHVYEGANHAFANPSGQRYDAAAAEQAWSETLAFLAQHVKGSA